MSEITVKVSFDYDPEDPDPDDSTGMSAEEYDELMEQLQALGADNIVVRQAAT